MISSWQRRQTLPIVTFGLRGWISPQQLATAHSAIVEEVTRDGRRWISETIVKGQSVLRMMVISYLTEARHLEGLANRVTGCGWQINMPARTKA